MYGDLLSYSVDRAVVAMRDQMGRGGALLRIVRPMAPGWAVTLAARFIGRLHRSRRCRSNALQMGMSLDVTKCPTCDIAWFDHKMRVRNELDPKCSPNSPHFAKSVTF